MNKVIEILERLVKNWSLGKMDVDSEAITQAIQWGEALQSAEGELPEIPYSKLKEIICYHKQNNNIKDEVGILLDLQNLFEKNLDLCKPILANWIACKKRYQDSLGERTGELITLQNDL
ncbi:hypothetical protein LCGC14_1898000, partial [marine sediment metagenome]